MKLNFFHAAVLSAVSYGLFIGHASAETTFSYQFVDTYDEVCGEDNDDDGCAEISAYDHDLGRLFTTNGSGNAIRVLELFESNKLQDAGSISLAAYGAAPNSVAAHNGVLAVAVEADDKQAPGSVVFFDSLTLEFQSSVAVGALPDMIAFTPDGRYLVVANEGEPSDDYSVDPEGSISIINVATSDVSHAFFTAFNNAIDPEVRIFGPNASVAQDLEPEYIAISPDSSTAYVSLQENNALAVVDIEQATVLDVIGLGFKDHSFQGNGFDASNRDGGDSCAFALEDLENCINIMTQPTFGMYQPDAIASYSVDGIMYLVSANEGDARDYEGFSEEFRVGDDEYVLDRQVFDGQGYPTADVLKDDSVLGRLKITNATGDTDQDGDFDQIYSYGARSFSIWSEAGDLIFDSGDEFEQTLKKLQAAGEDVWVDSRSDDKGPEPESITVAEINGRHIAFIGLERVSGVMVYDITSQSYPHYVGYINTKKAGDISPEGLLYVARTDDSGALVVTNEVSNTTSVYRVSLSAGADTPSGFTVNNDSIVINSDDYYQVQTADTYQTICEGEMLGTCVTGTGVFNVVNLTTGTRDENVEVFAGGGASGPVVTGNVISWVGEGYYQVQSTEDFQSICEGTGFNSCEVPPGSYHLINHTTSQRDEFIEVRGVQ